MLTPGSARRRRRGPLLAAAVVLLLAGGAAAFVLLRAPGDESHPDVEFTAPKPLPPSRPRDTFRWPYYGYDAARTRYFPSSPRLRPPFRRIWSYRGVALLEFPPVIDGPKLYWLDDKGFVLAVDKRRGKVRWKKHLGALAAASPAVGQGRVFVVLLVGKQGPGRGRVAALSERTGRVLWSHDLASRAESPPLLTRHGLYFGSEDGTVYALDPRTGRRRWTYRAQGAVKGGPALSGGNLYFGDYSGHAHAVRARDGRELWNVGTSGARFGFGSGNFYATAAVAFGRVYLGNTDGRVYSFAAHSGRLAWATRTAGYVYSSTAVADVPGLGPTAYVGSYDGSFYALDARTGQIRWTHSAGGKISGSPTLVGSIVYYSNLAAKSTAGLDARTGKQVFSFRQGSFSPVITDGKRVFLVGYADLFAVTPRGRRR